MANSQNNHYSNIGISLSQLCVVRDHGVTVAINACRDCGRVCARLYPSRLILLFLDSKSFRDLITRKLTQLANLVSDSLVRGAADCCDSTGTARAGCQASGAHPTLGFVRLSRNALILLMIIGLAYETRTSRGRRIELYPSPAAEPVPAAPVNWLYLSGSIQPPIMLNKQSVR